MKQMITGLCCLLAFTAISQSRTETTTQRQALPGPDAVLVIANISGDITVNTYQGTDIGITMQKTVTGKDDAAVNQGFSDIQVKIEVMGDTVVCYIDHPCGGKKQRVSSDRVWKYYLGDCEWSKDYDHEINFTVQVPRGVHLRASTINNGEVSITGIEGNLEVDNVNGGIALYGIKPESLRVSSINGEVSLNCVSPPSADSRLYALNGDITATFPNDLSATVSFTTFNGELFTEFASELNSPELKSLKPDDQHGTKYKVGGYPVMTIGEGGIALEVETFNGNAYLRKTHAR